MNLDDLLQIAGRRPRVGTVAIGDQTIHVRGLSAADSDWASRVVSRSLDDDGELPEGAPSSRTLMLAKALCDEQGNPLCGDPVKHAADLAKLPEVLFRRLFAEVERLSDLQPGDAAELVGN